MDEIEKRVLNLELFQIHWRASELVSEKDVFGCGFIDFIWEEDYAKEFKRIKDQSRLLGDERDEQVDSMVRGHLEKLNALDCEEDFFFGENDEWLNHKESLTDEQKKWLDQIMEEEN